MVADRRDEETDLVSPELVLVASAEDARRERERLAVRPPAEPTFVRRAPPPSYPQITVADEPRERPPRRGRQRVLAAVVLAAAIAVSSYFAATRGHHHSTTAPAPRAPSPTKGDALPTPNPPTATARARTARPRTARPKHAKTTRKHTSTAKPPKVPAGFVPSRVWAWPPRSGAAAYVVTFFRGGRRLFGSRTVKPRLVLPASFRYAAGRYRWTVRSSPARAGAKPIVDSTFTVTKAAAVAANRR